MSTLGISLLVTFIVGALIAGVVFYSVRSLIASRPGMDPKASLPFWKATLFLLGVAAMVFSVHALWYVHRVGAGQ